MTLEDLIAHGNKIKKLIKKEKFSDSADILSILNGTESYIFLLLAIPSSGTKFR